MDLQHAPPPSLAELIESDVEPRRVWHADELGEVLAHELTTPVRLELGELAPGDAAAAAADSAGPLSIGDLLHHPAPPLELLVPASSASPRPPAADPQGHLPEDVAAVLYAMAIAAARLRHGHASPRCPTARRRLPRLGLATTLARRRLSTTAVRRLASLVGSSARPAPPA